VNGVAGLKLRAQRANLMHADLFLSVHHDAVRDEYLKPWIYQDNANHYFDGAKGFSLHVGNNGESLRLARMLADQLLANGLDFTTIHRRDQIVGARAPFADATRGIYLRERLVVLYKTQMPSVLLESGLIVNREEEVLLSTSAHQAVIATAVVQGVAKYCGFRLNPSYRVANVASNDVLNVRSGPSDDYSILEGIPHDGRGIQIVGTCTGIWCPVDYRGARGWVDRQFLTSE